MMRISVKKIFSRLSRAFTAVTITSVMMALFISKAAQADQTHHNRYVPFFTEQDLSIALKKINGESDFDLFYTDQNLSKTLNLKNSAKPNILFLNSKNHQVYDINNIKGSNCKAIVYSGVAVQLNLDGDVKLFHLKKMPPLHSIYPKTLKCTNNALKGVVCPEFTEFTKLNGWTTQIAGQKITGFTPPAGNAISSISVPQTVLDEGVYKEIEKSISAIESEKKELAKRVQDPFYMYKGQSWFDILHVRDDEIPSNAFLAYYTSKIISPDLKYTEIVPTISLEYLGNKFHGIKADNFVGYYVGDFEFVRPVEYQFDVTLSRAKIKVIIDKKVVYDGSNSTTFLYKFSPAKKYRIEIEYINNYSQVDIQINMKKAAKKAEKQL